MSVVSLTSRPTSWSLVWWIALGLLLGLAPVVALVWYADQLARSQLLSLAAVTVVVDLIAFCRLSGRPLFGPILFYDLIRSARQGRHAIFRCLYLTVLLIMLFLLYVNRFGT